MPRVFSGAAALAAGSVTNAMLASPTAGTYKHLIAAGGLGTTAAASGTNYVMSRNNTNSAAIGAVGAAASLAEVLNLNAADLAVTGLTTKLMIRATASIGGTGPAVTITFGLYPLTIAASNWVLGTVVPGSTIAIASPGANAVTAGQATDFTLPADGMYTPGYVVSGTPAANFALHFHLYYRNV